MLESYTIFMNMNTNINLNNTAIFDYRPLTHLVYGNDSIRRLNEFVNEYDGKHILIISEPSVKAAGHIDRVLKILAEENHSVTIYDDAKETPTIQDVNQCYQSVVNAQIDLIIGLGSGGCLDTAKACNFLLTNGGVLEDYQNPDQTIDSMLPVIAIPTTAGTGSECLSYAQITNAKTNKLLLCRHPNAAPVVAIIDPIFTLSLPMKETIESGMGVLALAIESAVSSKRNRASAMFSREAFKLIGTSFTTVMAEPENLKARAGMLLGSAYAGIAVENSMLGAAHAAAQPLTIHYGLPRGHAVCLMLPHVISHNGRDPQLQKIYAELAATAARLVAPRDSDTQAMNNLIAWLFKILNSIGFSPHLKTYGIASSDLPQLANEAVNEWTAMYNPIPLQTKDYLELYQKAL